MKLSSLVASLIPAKHVFCVSGGASLHLIHSFHPRTVPMQTEQGAGFAADAYARIKGLGCALVTSGPGATNLVTAIATSYYDSVPVVYLTGQVASFRRSTGQRQFGFQETPILEMVKPVCKYAVEITPQNVRYEIEKAIHIATSGRKGPVVIDIPDDYQRADVGILTSYACNDGNSYEMLDPPHDWLRDLHQCKRPVFLFGAGIREHKNVALELAHELGIPIALTWGSIDCFDHRDGLIIGATGTHANRAPNFVIQNADYIVSVGCRLDTKTTGTPGTFARAAKLVAVDIDAAEFGKVQAHRTYCLDAGIFLNAALRFARATKSHDGSFPDFIDWQLRINEWKRTFPVCSEPIYRLMASIKKRNTIVSDTGLALAWLMQSHQFTGERMIHAFNQTPMGYGLPAAIGAAFATNEPVTLIAGDGGFSASICELATVKRRNLPIDIHVFNNRGHGMCRQTQRQWLGGTYPATSIEGGLPDIDFAKVMAAYGVEGTEHRIDEGADLDPLVKFGRPNEDATPLLNREVLQRHMLIPTI